MPKRTIFDITLESGKTNLGKYTFPKMPALATKVLDVFIRQAEK